MFTPLHCLPERAGLLLGVQFCSGVLTESKLGWYCNPVLCGENIAQFCMASAPPLPSLEGEAKGKSCKSMSDSSGSPIQKPW